MTEEDVKKINEFGRMKSVGAIAEKFDSIIEQIGKVAGDYRISPSIHKTINPMLDDMIRQLYIMRNNVMACMIGVDDTPMKVAQPTKFYRCEDCANKDTDVCDGCMGLNESGSKPSKWEQIENCSTCKYDYSPMNARCVGCNVILPVYPHGISVYQHWESKESSTHKDCDEGRICPICGKVMILCEDEKTYNWLWECDVCGHKEDE